MPRTAGGGGAVDEAGVGMKKLARDTHMNRDDRRHKLAVFRGRQGVGCVMPVPVPALVANTSMIVDSLLLATEFCTTTFTTAHSWWKKLLSQCPLMTITV
jgi:hypothetical protein